MIPVGKVFVVLIWLFWMMVVDNTAIGQDNKSMQIMDHSKMTLSEIEKVKSMVMVRDRIIKKPEYNPTYGTTYQRVIERGAVICGTNDEFPGFSEEVFDALNNKVVKYYNRSDDSKRYIFDGFAGADPTYSLNVRIIAKKAWQAHFVHNMFIRPEDGELDDFNPGFTIINASDVSNKDFKTLGMNSETFILFHLGRLIAIIGGTEYGGEMKKGIFSVLHYLLPQRGVLSMHCSANVYVGGSNPAIFFGLSGTGKTTLSTDPLRPLIGDDEHGWSDDGIFNFEGGCYAKVINLNKDEEPDIYNAIRKGALMENVVYNEENKVIDFF